MNLKTKKYRVLPACLTAVCLSGFLSVTALGLELIPVGSAIGIEVDVDGVLVEKCSEVETSSGKQFPAKAAGIKAGDVIEILFGTRSVKVEVLDVQETVRKETAGELFKYL